MSVSVVAALFAARVDDHDSGGRQEGPALAAQIIEPRYARYASRDTAKVVNSGAVASPMRAVRSVRRCI